MWDLQEREEFETGRGPAPAQLPLTTASQEITQRRHRTAKLCTLPSAQGDGLGAVEDEEDGARTNDQWGFSLTTMAGLKGLVPSGNSLYQVCQSFDEPQHIPGVPLCFEPVTGGTLGGSDLSTDVAVKPGVTTVGTLSLGKGNFKES